jgi:hypothetical protein
MIRWNKNVCQIVNYMHTTFVEELLNAQFLFPTVLEETVRSGTHMLVRLMIMFSVIKFKSVVSIP